MVLNLCTLSENVSRVTILLLYILSDDAFYGTKFHENISKGFRVIKQTCKNLLTA